MNGPARGPVVNAGRGRVGGGKSLAGWGGRRNDGCVTMLMKPFAVSVAVADRATRQPRGVGGTAVLQQLS
jgi:hypothetical protein